MNAALRWADGHRPAFTDPLRWRSGIHSLEEDAGRVPVAARFQGGQDSLPKRWRRALLYRNAGEGSRREHCFELLVIDQVAGPQPSEVVELPRHSVPRFLGGRPNPPDKQSRGIEPI